ncbi:hypothetical protein DPEC_G00223930 [Dallia pectoralis]|uniref:Uncharacterized protein n=1 Tax=Dallia pectoralis TaxID=75939 RepID=A0ACC2FZZ4_DALPE|nr:hypothetical protein DPEC_G00223930 [Dallia pectoralis]
MHCSLARLPVFSRGSTVRRYTQRLTYATSHGDPEVGSHFRAATVNKETLVKAAFEGREGDDPLNSLEWENGESDGTHSKSTQTHDDRHALTNPGRRKHVARQPPFCTTDRYCTDLQHSLW